MPNQRSRSPTPAAAHAPISPMAAATLAYTAALPVPVPSDEYGPLVGTGPSALLDIEARAARGETRFHGYHENDGIRSQQRRIAALQ
jgi:hypothetical protein